MSTDSDWYLIYTKPRQERIAKENLERQGYRIYLPFIQVNRRRSKCYQLVTEPLFPRYLFIFLNIDKDNWGPICSTRGVSALVRFGGIPAKVAPDFVQFLKNNETLAGAPAKVSLFQKGQRVQIIDGIMAGYEGIFEMHSGAKRVTLLLNMLGKVTRVEVPLDSVTGG
ncbi:transcription/translation regulatory transformer protein RfaH [Coxiella endosymbiont of Ornithodoros amblus]|uniref:transcription/translation regulatory transformer protein RfaH n=1 Tax=Coxiella endosymbiont of Ornithodoros amblus TaxID=1656166 RepID=UPI00244E147F|nr:transcription/translation regulatory transformer protein RfaH [Coxiella endosymbiont of Ornithodoros amblus]MBW5802257.1 transcription/translation regulatory transformer protein RfaH [Coxiella endosymbiont of Ornithodoros amblus]